MATYIIRAGLAGPVKIGKADDSNQRLRELQTGNHERLHLLRVVDTPFDAEPMFHERFSALRLRGEWFEFSDEMLTFVPTPKARPDGDSLADGVVRFGIKRLAQKIGASFKTVEHWANGRGGPQARFAIRMLQDDETKHIVLAAAGRRDLIDPQETIRDLARQVLAKHGPDHPVLQLPDVKAVLEADERCAALGAVEGK
jgi:hypothetical protein